jgi:lipid-A-disaccharide synthase
MNAAKNPELAAEDRAQSGPHIFLVAGEESGDRLGAALMTALREKTQGRARFSGVGGQHMAEQGLASLFPLGDLAIMGFSAIPASLPKIIHRVREAAAAAVAARPNVVVIIDSPEFTHRVARRVRASAPSIPIVDYVSPSVWAWRSGRARAMRAYVDHVLALLPFEPAAMRRLGGPACTYVGHPLIERAGEFRANAEEARRRLSDPPLLLVLPGSRSAEIRRLAPLFGDVLARIRGRLGALDVVVPAVDRLAGAVRAATASWPVPVRVVTNPAEKQAAFRTARAALTKSGTSTLELAIAGVPMVAAYRVSLLEEMIGRLFIRVPSYILANLVLGESVVPEFLQRYGTPETVSAALLPLLTDTPQRQAQIEAFRRLDAVLEIGTARPSDRAAAIVLDYATGLNQPERETVASNPPTA